MAEVRVRAASLRRPFLHNIPFNPSDGLSPDEAAVLAVIANPELKALRDRRGVAAAQVLQAGLLPNPDFSYSLDAPVGGVRAGKVTAFGLGLDWEVSRLLGRNARPEAARDESAALDPDIADRIRTHLVEYQQRSGATLLLRDEPTDNLDLVSAEALEQGLASYHGTVIAVTHDRWFARGFDRFLVFGGDGEVYQAGIGQGFDTVTPIELANAYSALANGGKLYQPQIVDQILGPDGSVVEDVQPKLIRKVAAPASVLKTMREATLNAGLIRHTYNRVDEPFIVAAKTGTAEFGLRDKQGRLPFHSWFAGFVPKDPFKTASDPTGMKAVDRTDSNLVVVVLAYDSRTIGNAATEIAKYFLQLHFDTKVDLRLPWLMKVGNHYGD